MCEDPEARKEGQIVVANCVRNKGHKRSWCLLKTLRGFRLWGRFSFVELSAALTVGAHLLKKTQHRTRLRLSSPLVPAAC